MYDAAFLDVPVLYWHYKQNVVHSIVIDKSLFKNEKLILGAVKSFDSPIVVELYKKFDKLMHFLKLYCNVPVHKRFCSLQKLDHNILKDEFINCIYHTSCFCPF